MTAWTKLETYYKISPLCEKGGCDETNGFV
jgi:hypothetical protein